MSAITAEMEMELEQELASENAAESAHEHVAHEQELEMEQEAFFNHLAAMAQRGGRSQALRRIAIAAARQALRGLRTEPPGIEGEYEIGGPHAFALEMEAHPLQAEQANAMMEHISHEAATAESEQEAAEQFLPLIPLAAKFVLPLAAKVGAKAIPLLAKRFAPRIISRVVPHLTRGVSQIARTLFRSPAARPLLRAIPNIAKRTVATLARQAIHGRRITPQTAVRTLARQTVRVLSNPRQAVSAYRRSHALDRRFHTAARRYIGRPISAATGRAIPWGWRRRRFGRPTYGQPVHQQAVRSTPGVSYPVAPSRRFPAGVAAATVAPAAAIAPCQCFQPVNCASCGPAGGCPTCGR